MTGAQTTLRCPMHAKPYPKCLPDGTCPECGREWTMDEGGNMASKKRMVRVCREITEGADINEVLQPVKTN